MIYQVRLAPEAMARLSRLPARVATPVANFIREKLGKYPETIGVPLSGRLKGHLVVKREQYRIIYTVDPVEATVDILEII
ncbi:type II toxin-antitoxin system RelE/ParE family toxin [Umezawaea endophytica]|uniref:mRNA interferase RelE/StbE n=1 Tax=Umezawaea endophytica TaxID=1654476 RepID=A0A9X2VU63_9PSEU|nr:hypothetical protein [Umezawaea endophytica]MCS7482412.1 hypothetical protein [Umezawaea endophytica]